MLSVLKSSSELQTSSSGCGYSWFGLEGKTIKVEGGEMTLNSLIIFFILISHSMCFSFIKS